MANRLRRQWGADDEWTPAQLNPSLWLDASSPVGVTVDTSARVSSWLDLSGNGRNASQSTDGYKPLLSRADNQENLLTLSGPTSLTDIPTKDQVTVDAVTPADWNNISSFAVTFGTNSVTRYAYKSFTTVSGVNYLFSMFVRMDDASAPTVGSGQDFSLVLKDVSGGADTVTLVGSGLYLVTKAMTGTGAGGYWGAIKLTGHTSKAFKITGWWLRTAAADSTYLATTTAPQYRGLNSRSCLVFDGVDDILATAGNASTIFGVGAKTIAMVVRPLVLGKTFLSQQSTYTSMDTNGSGALRSGNYDTNWDFATTANVVTAGQTAVCLLTHDGTNITAQLNGGAVVSAASGNSGSLASVLKFGYSTAPTIYMCEGVFLPRIGTASELQQLNNYLTRKWVT